MNRGYIRLWRKVEDSPVFADSHLFHLFAWCLLKATHRVRSVPVRTGRGQTVVTLRPGSFIFGRNTAAAELRWAPSTVRDRMRILKNLKIVVTQPDTHYSVITIVNWGNYQHDEEAGRQATRQATRQASATDNNYKKKERPTAAAAKDAGPSAGKILGFDTVGRPLYAEPTASKAAR